MTRTTSITLRAQTAAHYAECGVSPSEFNLGHCGGKLLQVAIELKLCPQLRHNRKNILSI